MRARRLGGRRLAPHPADAWPLLETRRRDAAEPAAETAALRLSCSVSFHGDPGGERSSLNRPVIHRFAERRGHDEGTEVGGLDPVDEFLHRGAGASIENDAILAHGGISARPR